MQWALCSAPSSSPRGRAAGTGSRVGAATALALSPTTKQRNKTTQQGDGLRVNPDVVTTGLVGCGYYGISLCGTTNT